MNFLLTLLLLVSIESIAVTKIAPQAVRPAEYRVGEWIADHQLDLLSGQSGMLSEFQHHKALVLVMNKYNCPLCRKYGPTLSQLILSYKEKGVQFLLVNASSGATNEQIKDFLKTFKIDVPVVLDREHRLAKALFAHSTTEVFVLDRARTLVYRGAINDQYGIGYSLTEPKNNYLIEAIEAVLANGTVERSSFTAPGCQLGLAYDPEPVAPLTYHNRISRIVQRSCQPCHRPGEAAPFTLMNLQDVLSFKNMIQFVVDKQIMPPWFASPHTGEWKNDRSLTVRDRNALLGWLKGGTPVGDPKQAPLPKQWVQGWEIGQPDLVLQIPEPITVPAEGVVPYLYRTVKHTLKEDRWIKALEIRPTSPEVVHHVLVIAKPEGSRDDNPPTTTIRGYFAAMVPGQKAIIYPADQGRLLPKGTELLFQLHYTPNGVETTDQTRLGMIFHKERPKYNVGAHVVMDTKFEIPPHHPNYEVSAEYTFEKRTRILNFLPHMHLRGKSFRYEILYPDQSRKTVLEVPEYDFNWQLIYELQQPLEVEPGTKLIATGWFDNSENNPANPDPTVAVKYGDQTFEEMMVGFFESYPLE